MKLSLFFIRVRVLGSGLVTLFCSVVLPATTHKQKQHCKNTEKRKKVTIKTWYYLFFFNVFKDKKLGYCQNYGLFRKTKVYLENFSHNNNKGLK